jgi:hypothetical protein
MDLKAEIPKLLLLDPTVTSVQLAGSRERGDENALSDWDFVVATDDAVALREDISHLVASLNPLVGQWDRLGPVWCYMLILKGGVKVDIILEETTQVDEPPWKVSAANLPAIDDHFWDWTLWLGSKCLKDDSDMVTRELTKMFDHLLEPLGVRQVPESIGEAISAYTAARDHHTAELGVRIELNLQSEVIEALRRSGLDI